jgi:K+-transporting ATPase ATPase C chain
VVTGIGKITIAEQANGSLIWKNNQIIGSTLIGQNFSSPNYFWGRPSATSPMPYNALNSGGSNFGPTNPAQKAAVVDRIKALRDADPDNKQEIPVDLVTASGSGLDPEISPAGAYFQAGRVARLRNIPAEAVKKLIAAHIEEPQLGLLGEARINVLKLNLALDKLTTSN